MWTVEEVTSHRGGGVRSPPRDRGRPDSGPVQRQIPDAQRCESQTDFAEAAPSLFGAEGTCARSKADPEVLTGRNTGYAVRGGVRLRVLEQHYGRSHFLGRMATHRASIISWETSVTETFIVPSKAQDPPEVCSRSNKLRG